VREARAAEDRADALRGTTVNGRLLDAAAYQWMRLVSEQHRLLAESKALEMIAAQIGTAKRDGKSIRKRS
jgi:hypothetical protein